MPVCAIDVLEVIPLDLHAGLVVVLTQVQVLDPCDVDLVEDRMVYLHGKLFFTRLCSNLNPRGLGELGVMFGRHHIFGANP